MDIKYLLETFNSVTPFMIFLAIVFFAYFFLHEWRVSRRRDFDLRQEEMKLSREKKYSPSTNIVVDNNKNENPSDLGGYVIMDMPDERKSIFHDVLKGFEEFASIKGYHVSISIDSSIPDKIAFKFTLNDFGVSPSSAQVKKDLDEYIDKMKKGESIDDLPEVNEPVEHNRLVMALKNRVSFLQQNYEVQKNIKEFYEKFFRQLNIGAISHSLPAIQINQGGIDMDQRKYIANNSAGVSQGDNQSNLIEAHDISIGDSFSERKDMILKLDELISVLRGSSDGDVNLTKAQRHLESVKDELEDEKEPDKGIVAKLLGKTKELLGIAKASGEVVTKAKEVFESFGIS